MSEIKKTPNPQSSFQWRNDTVFVLNGQEMRAILNGFRVILDSPEAKRFFLAMQGAEAAETILQRAVKEGIVEEIKKEEAPK